MPRIGGVREIYSPDLRYFPVGVYVIYYHLLDGNPGIEILRILHGRRNTDSIFGTGQEDA